MAADAIIHCRVSLATKTALRAAAQRQEITESALIKRMLELMLQTAPAADSEDLAPRNRARLARVYVRLPSHDWSALRARASARSMAPATYATHLLHSHLQAVAPLPQDELAAVKEAARDLRAIGTNLNQIARAAHQSGRVTGPTRDDLRAFLKVCEGLRDHLRGLIKANARSWESHA